MSGLVQAFGSQRSTATAALVGQVKEQLASHQASTAQGVCGVVQAGSEAMGSLQVGLDLDTTHLNTHAHSTVHGTQSKEANKHTCKCMKMYLHQSGIEKSS